jgi:ribose 5-phosphate isomerase B
MIYLASDHRGFELKEKIKVWLAELGFEYVDCGASEYNADDDYPDFVHTAAKAVSLEPNSNKAIILGASGQGEAMVANRYPEVRAIVYYGPIAGETISDEVVVIGRVHNNANVLSIGAAPGMNIKDAQPIDERLVRKAVELFLQTPFSADPRHVRRIAKIERQETM